MLINKISKRCFKGLKPIGWEDEKDEGHATKFWKLASGKGSGS